ncbi:MAG: hypothetical protein ACYCO5_09450 [Acidobacteriaceae bacterium]
MTKHTQGITVKANDALPDFTRSLNVLNTKTPAENPFLQPSVAQPQRQQSRTPATSQSEHATPDNPISSNK